MTKPFVYVAAAFSALGGMLFGYDIGVISGTILRRLTLLAYCECFLSFLSARFTVAASAIAKCGGAPHQTTGSQQVLFEETGAVVSRARSLSGISPACKR